MWLQITPLMRDYVPCLGVSQEYLSIHPTLVAQDILTQILSQTFTYMVVKQLSSHHILLVGRAF